MADKRISGRTVHVAQLPATEALDLLLTVTKLLGPSLPHILDAMRGNAERAGLRAIADVVASANTIEARNLIVRTVETAEIQSPSGGFDKIIMDAHFHGDLMGALEVFRFVMEVQFTDFFTGVRQSAVFRAIFSPTSTSAE